MVAQCMNKECEKWAGDLSKLCVKNRCHRYSDITRCGSYTTSKVHTDTIHYQDGDISIGVSSITMDDAKWDHLIKSIPSDILARSHYYKEDYND